MTPQKQEQTNPMFHYFQMEDLVPEDHILRQIDEAVDFSFVRDVVSDCYCPDNGRPGIDPELVVRMILIGYLYNLSENRLCQEVGMHAAYRLFCHQTFDDAVLDRSTINKLRNHKWASSGLFERIMRQVVQCCIDVGLVSGKHLSVDGTQIQADASVKSIEPIEPPVSLDDYLKGIGFEGDKTKGRSGHPQDKDFHGEKWTNQTHRSTTDPDARLYSKSKGKGAFLSFMGHDLIDTKSRVILETQGTQATGTAEPESALKIVDDLETYTMPKDIQTLSADTGYGSGNFIADVLDRGIIPHIPLRADEKIEPIPTWKNKTNSAHIQAERDRKVREAKARNHARSISLTADYKLSQRLRKRSEHIFAEAKQQHGMGRARYRGLASLNEQLNLVATVQNLKRLVSFIKKGESVYVCPVCQRQCILFFKQLLFLADQNSDKTILLIPQQNDTICYSLTHNRRFRRCLGHNYFTRLLSKVGIFLLTYPTQKKYLIPGQERLHASEISSAPILLTAKAMTDRIQ